MTATESLKLYQLFFQLTKNETEAKNFVSEFERSIDNSIEKKFEKENKQFALRTEFDRIESKIDLLRQEVKNYNLEIEVKIANRINSLIIWIVSTGIAIVGLTFTLSKFFK